MSQTLVIRTPDAVSTTSRTFPKQGVFNLKITKNDTFDTVEIWVRCGASNITLELAGASFQSTAQVVAPRTIPLTPTVISGSTLALTPGVTQYMKIKLNNGISVAHLRCSYTAKSANATVAGGNIRGQAFVDYSKKPYISTSLERMFTTYPVKTDLTKWDISSVTSLNDMFLDNITFNQPIGNWNVSNVTNMSSIFRGAATFDQPIGNWNVSNVTNMSAMFRDATLFNQPINNWNVSNVTNMSGMFQEAATFNQPIHYWNVSNVTNMGAMFQGAIAFNQPIGNWNVSNVTSMGSMFFWSRSFNQPIGNWNVSNVTSMHNMFYGAAAFNQDLSSWAAKFNVNVSLAQFFPQTTWGTTNYDKFLNALWTDINTTRPQAWALRTEPKLLGMGFSKYSAASAAARASLVSNGWTITDGGLSA
ncbi:DUF285 domain-containing protein [Acinetobacter variabilis]|uniref:BspA family leucine-rich repeat surface protein n=1 Tax=Acinetobacter variabilis TaxID=70346 RepID=UPI0021CD5947|nr:BspA family leucine-rich repeat surface protein [Acinetobacter variabilis]MCU4365651.1 DUF285 domain-containing protein [Acinetobacter variabilis]